MTAIDGVWLQDSTAELNKEKQLTSWLAVHSTKAVFPIRLPRARPSGLHHAGCAIRHFRRYTKHCPDAIDPPNSHPAGCFHSGSSTTCRHLTRHLRWNHWVANRQGGARPDFICREREAREANTALIAMAMSRLGGRFSRDGQWQWLWYEEGIHDPVLALQRDLAMSIVNPPTSIAVLRVAPDPINLLRLYCLLDSRSGGQSESFYGDQCDTTHAASSLSRAGPINLQSASSM